MKSTAYYIFVLICLYPFTTATGQINIDSIENILQSSEDNHVQGIAALTLSKHFSGRDLDKVREYAWLAEGFFRDTDSLRVEVLDQMARYYFFKSNLDSALYFFQEAQVTADKIPNEFLQSSLGNSIASVYIRQSKFEKALEELIASANYFESIKDESGASKCYSNMSAAHAALGNYDRAIQYSRDALAIFRKNGLDQYTLITLPNLATQYLQSGDTSQAITIFLEAEQMAQEQGNNRSLALTYNNLGDLYLTHAQYDKAKYYIEKSIRAKEELNLLKGIDNNYHNLGYVYAQTGNHYRAIGFYHKALEFADISNRVAIYTKLKDSYRSIGETSQALDYADRAIVLKDSIDQDLNAKNFAEISTKYETAKNENEILQLESQNQKLEIVKNRNRSMLAGALGIIIGLSLLAFLFFKNQKRKQLIAKQNHEIEQRRLLEEMQKQELESIDRIIQSQEEERNRISADLHDSLGSKMAALKLYVDALDTSSENSSEESLKQVQEIADAAYGEVRNMSHNLNSGVLIDRGLLPAIRKMSDFITDTKGLTIEVINLDMPDRLENKKEIQLFRIIQELLTNIIKHSNAQTAMIQLAGHVDMVSVTIEDDGQGFSNEQSGIGLQNVARRVSELGGTHEIDSVVGEGTSVIINIPI